MPLGTDVITWSPRVGDTGDDRYDPGETPLFTGPSTIVGTLPTLVEVNASQGINQVLMEMRRRYWNQTEYVPSGYLDVTQIPAYVTAINRKITAPWEATLKTEINISNGLREWEGQIPYPYVYPTPALAINKRLLRVNMLHLRKSLASDWITVPRWRDDHKIGTTHRATIRAAYAPYPTINSYSSTLTTATAVGQSGNSSSGYRSRGYLFFRLPTGLPTGLTGYLHGWFTRGAATKTFRIYHSTVHLGPIDNGDWGHLDTLLFSAANTSLAPLAASQYEVDIPLSMTFDGGTNYTLIAVHKEEVDEAGAYSSLDNFGGAFGGGVQSFLKLYTP